MTKIIESDDYKIIEDHKNKNTYSIIFNSPEEILIKSLTKSKIITGATVLDDYSSIKFKATSIKTFKQFKQEQIEANGTKKRLSTQTAAKILINLLAQLKYLQTHFSQTFIGYNEKDLIVIDETRFAFLAPELLYKIDRFKNAILISHPFLEANFFLSPELYSIKELPSYVNYKTTYFSLAYLIMNNLAPNSTSLNPGTNEIMSAVDELPICRTKLYWFLSRCLNPDPERREAIFI
jgi:hypothetical protein